MTYVLAFTDCQGNRHERDFESFDVAVEIVKEFFLRPDFKDVIVYKRRDARWGSGSPAPRHTGA